MYQLGEIDEVRAAIYQDERFRAILEFERKVILEETAIEDGSSIVLGARRAA
jgi:hypothetical protein